MGKKDDKNKFYFFKIDKDKIKLQLKNISSKFIKPKKNRKLISIIITFCLLIGVAIALYSNNFDSQLSTDSLNTEHQQQSDTGSSIEYSNSQSIDLNNEPLTLENKQQQNRQQNKEKEKVNKADNEQKAEGVVTESVTSVANRDEEQKNIQLLKPVAGEVFNKPGWYFHPVFEDWRFQKGAKMEGNTGDIVMAAESGKVTSVYEDEYKGLVVKIKHDNGWHTLYGYLQKTPLAEGEVVGKGQEVGRIGTSGITEQPCLYFELLNDGETMNPVEYFE